MRQDAILIALQRYLRDRMIDTAGHQTNWNAAKNIASALQIKRRDFAIASKKEWECLEALPEDYYRASHHPSMDETSDLTKRQLDSMLHTAIRKLLDEGRITQPNAAVTLALLVDGIRAADIARRLGVHRSAICHHFFRVRRLLPDVLDGIEVPRSEIIFQ